MTPSPDVYVESGSQLTVSCAPEKSWTEIIFQDYGIKNGGVIVVIFTASSTNCKDSYIDTQFGNDRYSALPCNLGKPVEITIQSITTAYHNKTISCQVDEVPQVHTVVRIRGRVVRYL